MCRNVQSEHPSVDVRLEPGFLKTPRRWFAGTHDDRPCLERNDETPRYQAQRGHKPQQVCYMQGFPAPVAVRTRWLADRKTEDVFPALSHWVARIPDPHLWTS